MTSFFLKSAVLAAALTACWTVGPAARAQGQETTLRIFVGGQQRPDVWERIVASYEESHPGIDVEIEVGGATSEAQQQYLTTVLTAEDPAIDLMLVDIVRPAQFAAAGWAEPLDGYLEEGERDRLLDQFLPAYAEATSVDGELYALPSFADALFLYYRTDLLKKYGLAPPATWEEARRAAAVVLEGEKDPSLQGVSFQGAPIEGTVCTFLMPVWSAGGDIVDADGAPDVETDAAAASLAFWSSLRETGIAKRNVAEVRTDDTRREFQAGDAVMALLWAYGWSHFQNDADSAVEGKVGVVPVPSFGSGETASCLGGWLWSMSAFSAQKEEAYELMRFLSGPEASKQLAILGSNLPTRPELYRDPEVLEANPWFADALPAVRSARVRPVSANYAEISDVIRTNTNAVLAGTKTTEDALADMQSRLRRAMR